MKIINRSEWKKMWAELHQAGKTMPLMEFAVHCNNVKREWGEIMPWECVSNGRYEVYIQKLMTLGVEIPSEIIASITKDDLYFDWYCFPDLAPLLGYDPARCRKAA